MIKQNLKSKVLFKKQIFSPNTFAQSLKAKTTNLIGVIIPRLDSFATMKTLIGIDNTLQENNYQMLVANANQTIETEIQAMENFIKQRVAGIILLTKTLTNKHQQIIANSNIPILFVGQEYKDQYCLVHDDYDAAYELGAYVLSQGHRNIAYLGVEKDDISVGINRKNGFQKAIENLEPTCSVCYYETSFQIEDAMKQVQHILDNNRPTLIVCATDNIALGAMKVIHSHSLSVPGDISVTGFGGYDISRKWYTLA